MPGYRKRNYRKRKTPFRARRRHRARRRYIGPSRRTLNAYNNSVIADKVYAKLTYVDQGSLTSTSGSCQTLQWVVNNLYDPYYTGVGHQPRFFDQLAALYERYRVFGALVEVTATGVTGNHMIVLNAYPTEAGTTVINNCIEAVEQKLPYCVVPADEKVVMRKYFSMAKIWGVNNKRIANDDVFSAAVTGAPSWRAFLDMSHQSFDASSTTAADYMIKITYYCCFFSPTQIGPS